MPDPGQPADAAQATAGLTRALLAHRDSLMAFVIGITRDRDAAEDVFQDLGVAIVEAGARGFVPDDFLTWARTLARHRAIDHYRREDRRSSRQMVLDESALAVIDLAFSEEPRSDDREHARHLRRCLGRLTPRVQGLLAARYREGRSIEQIAGLTRWSANAVKVALSRARSALADCIERGRRVAG